MLFRSPSMVAGLLLALATGVALLVTKATDYISNPFIYVKFPAIVAGLLNAALLLRTRAWRAVPLRDLEPREERQLAAMAGVSLASWTTAVAAGRLVGYW